MSPKEFRGISPAPPSEIEVIESHQVTYEFYHEVKYRQAFQAYCQWYRATAQRNQEELQKMRGDINILGWFTRGSKASKRDSSGKNF